MCVWVRSQEGVIDRSRFAPVDELSVIRGSSGGFSFVGIDRAQKDSRSTGKGYNDLGYTVLSIDRGIEGR